jgi:hypothetical protein
LIRPVFFGHLGGKADKRWPRRMPPTSRGDWDVNDQRGIARIAVNFVPVDEHLCGRLLYLQRLRGPFAFDRHRLRPRRCVSARRRSDRFLLCGGSFLRHWLLYRGLQGLCGQNRNPGTVKQVSNTLSIAKGCSYRRRLRSSQTFSGCATGRGSQGGPGRVTQMSRRLRGEPHRSSYAVRIVGERKRLQCVASAELSYRIMAFRE